VIPQARPVLENLRQSGMYLSDRILNQALKLYLLPLYSLPLR
jgi:predicted nucleic acid-binding protein